MKPHRYWNRQSAESAEVQKVGAWESLNFAAVPGAWRGRVKHIFEARGGSYSFEANTWLDSLAASFRKLRVPINLDDGEIIAMADQCARQAMSMGEIAPGVFLSDPAALRARMASFCGRYGIAAPEALRVSRNGSQVGVSDAGALARMAHPLWWRRRLRQAQGRLLEGKAIDLGYVSMEKEIYASDVTVNRRRQQRARNAAGSAAAS